MSRKSDFFEKKRFLPLEGIISNDLCQLVTRYAITKEFNNFSPDTQVPNSHAMARDALFESLLFTLLPIMEKSTKLSLCPTYSFCRIYRPGMELRRHVDRESCEISVTICFGYSYDDQKYKWPIKIIDGETKDEVAVTQVPGDGLIYRGCELQHWRDKLDVSDNNYQVQAFFHFIDKFGPHYPKYAYEGGDRKKVKKIDRILRGNP